MLPSLERCPYFRRSFLNIAGSVGAALIRARGVQVEEVACTHIFVGRGLGSVISRQVLLCLHMHA